MSGRPERPNRREFLVHSARCAVAGGLLVGGVLMVRGGNGQCRRIGACEGCELAEECGLGKAMEYRRRGSSSQ